MELNKFLLICRRKMQAMNTFIFLQLFPLHKSLPFTDYRPCSKTLALYAKHFMFWPLFFVSSFPFYTRHYTSRHGRLCLSWAILTSLKLQCSFLTCEHLVHYQSIMPFLLSCDLNLYFKWRKIALRSEHTAFHKLYVL